MSEKTIYVKVAGEMIPYTKKNIKSMFGSQIERIKKNLVNPSDSKVIDKWLTPDPME